MLLTHNFISAVRFHLYFLTLFQPFPFKFIPNSKFLTFTNISLKRELFQHGLQILTSIIIGFQLYRFRSLFPMAIIFEGILYLFLSPVFAVLARVYFKGNKCVVELFNVLVTFEQKLINGKKI